MTYLRPSVELCSFSVLGELIFLDEGSATNIFSRLCGMEREEGRSAVRTFQKKAQLDARWLELLAQIDADAVTEHPEALMLVLTEGFGLYELDAIDIVLRLSEQAIEAIPQEQLN